MEEIKALQNQLHVAQSSHSTTREDPIANLHAAWKKERQSEQKQYQAREEKLMARITHLEEEKSILGRKLEQLIHHCQYLQRQQPPLFDTHRVWSARTVRMVVEAMHAGHISLSSTERVYSIFAELFLGQPGVKAPDRLTIANWSAEIYHIQREKVVAMAKEAGVIHVQFDAGKRRGETHFPV